MKKQKPFLIVLFQAFFLALAIGVFALGSGAPSEAYASDLPAAISETAAQSEQTFTEAPETLSDLQAAAPAQLDHWADGMERFDGRDYGYITPEGNQGSLGICWAYAAVGAVEANILRDGVDPEADRTTLNLDEMIAAYARFNRDGESDPLYLTTNDTYSSSTWKSSGDFANNALMSMTQGYSLVDQVSNQNWSDWALKQRLAPSRYFVQGFKQIDHTQEAIKRAVLEYGGVTMEYKAPETMYQTYVCHLGSGAGHASLIIGWDDSIPKTQFRPDQPSTDGAWIVKNSWGPGGDKGVNGTCCFYLSYEAYMTDNLYVVDMALGEDYRNIYYYDGSISEDTSQYHADAYGAIYEAKLSTANEREQLTAVSFGLRNTQSTVDIKVYRLSEANFGNVNDEINRPDSGTLIGQKNGVHFEDDGFYTVDFDEPINLAQGEIFSIVISGTDSKNGSLNPYFALDYADSLNDMTYRKYKGEWTSFKGYKGTYPGSRDGTCVRLRAITNVVKTDESLDNDLRYARMELDTRFVYYEKDVAQTPGLSVYFGSRILQEGEDYEVAYLNNSLPGTATVKVTGTGIYYGEQSAVFEIAKPLYPPGMIDGYIEVYSDTTRLSQIPVPDGWKWNESQDITLVTGDSGFGYQMKYMGDDGDCYQRITCSVKIYKNTFPRPAQLDIAGSTVTLGAKYTYTGAKIEPGLHVVCKGCELKPDTDYTVVYGNNTSVGTATVTITGCGKYTGSVTKQFGIKKAKWPAVRPKSTMIIGKDVTRLIQVQIGCPGWSWQESARELTGDEAEAVAIYIGSDMNNFANTKMTIALVRESETEQKSLASVQIDLENSVFVYDGEAKTPAVIARYNGKTLSAGTDFEVEYRDNTDAGTASVTVRGINGYTGTRILQFTINRADILGFTVSQEGWTYGGIAPAPTVTGAGDSAVTYSYSDSEEGTYTAQRPEKAGKYWIKAEIAQSRNYNAAEAKAPFTVEKAEKPSADTTIYCKERPAKLSDIPLPTGFTWSDGNAEVTGNSMTATAFYTAEDADCYEITELTFEIIIEEPEKPDPPTDPDPGEENPDPDQPTNPDPGEEKPDPGEGQPEQPEQPEQPDPGEEDPNQPTDPGEENPEQPTDPGEENPNQPAEPGEENPNQPGIQNGPEQGPPTWLAVAIPVAVVAAAGLALTLSLRRPRSRKK